MPYDDLDDDPGDQALDELGATLSGETTDDQEDDVDESEEDYDPETDPAFMTDKKRTQHTMYCLPDVWDEIDGSAGLLFETEATLRREGVDAIQKRELYNALLHAAAQQLTPEELAEKFKETREQRTEGPLL